MRPTDPKKPFARRIVRAILAGAVLFALLAGALGVLAAQDTGPGNPDRVEERVIGFQVAPPRAGDHFAYAFSEVNEPADRPSAPWEILADFEWRGSEVVFDAHGEARHVDVLRNTRHGVGFDEDGNPIPIVDDVLLDSQTGRTVAWRSEYNASRTHTDSLGLGTRNVESEGTRTDFVNLSYLERPDAFPHDLLPPITCGVRNPLQDSPYPAGGIDLFAACSHGTNFFDWYRGWDDVTMFRADAVGTVDGRDAIRFRAYFDAAWTPPTPPSTAAAPEITLWMAEEVPYPLRIEYTTFNDAGDAFADRYALVAYEPGGEALARHEALDLSAPELDWAPRLPWGPDETGFDHPFPLSEAWADARDHPTDARFRDFLSGHPDAQAVAAWYDEDWADGYVVREWRITASDGLAAQSVCPDRVEPSPAEPLGSVAPTTRRNLDCSGPGLPVDPACAGDTMPTAASLVRLWRASPDATGPTDPANTYEFGIRCQEAYHEHNLTFHVGHESVRTTEAPDGVAAPNREYRYDTLTVRMNGDVVSRAQSTSRYTWDPVSDKAPPVGGEEAPEPAAAHVGPAYLWSLPPEETLWAAGFAAAFAAAAYAAWPAVKAFGASVLYSRVERPTALEQGTRAEIARLVTQRPGIHFREIVRTTDWSRGTVEHHLRKLLDTGMITESSRGRYTCYFPRGDVDRRLMDAVAVLKSDGARRVLEAVLDSPGISATEAAAAAGLSRQAAHVHLRRMVAAGLATSRRRGRTAGAIATPLAEEALGLARQADPSGVA